VSIDVSIDVTQKEQQDGVQSAPLTTDRPQSAVANLVSAIWRMLANPILLLAFTTTAFLLALAALMTPQMPHPIYADPAAAVRWLLNISNDFGSLGELWSTLGLFNLLHSTLLRILLVLIALMLAIQIADQIGAALILRGLSARLKAPTRYPATPIALPKGAPIYRERSALPVSVEALSSETYKHLADRFDDTQQISVDLIAADGQDDGAETGKVDDVNTEERFLSVRALPFAYLRPLLLLGLLVGLLALWLDVTFGWEVISPSLAPTEAYQYPPLNLDIQYPTAAENSAGFAVPVLHMTLDGRQEMLAVGNVARVGENRIITRSSDPALQVHTVPDDIVMARPGDLSEAKEGDIGLSFPTPGSEASLILPDQSVGIRIIRRPVSMGDGETKDDEDYSVEIYEDGSAVPTERVTLDERKRQRIDVADGDVTLEFMPTVGVVVAVRSEPGSRLYWLALLLTVVGLVGFVRSPAYVLAQIGQWSPTKSYVVAQSNVKQEIFSLDESLAQRETERPEPTLEP
jgi:hypothetical protein